MGGNRISHNSLRRLRTHTDQQKRKRLRRSILQRANQLQFLITQLLLEELRVPSNHNPSYAWRQPPRASRLLHLRPILSVLHRLLHDLSEPMEWMRRMDAFSLAFLQ